VGVARTLVNLQLLFQWQIEESFGAFHHATLQLQWYFVAGDLEEPIVVATFANLLDQFRFCLTICAVKRREIENRWGGGCSHFERFKELIST
jgi:hypothetical protein